jgi:hypothetical protein
MDSYNQGNPHIFSLEVDEQGKATLLEMSRWTKFLAIIGFIFMGLMLLVFWVMGTAMKNMPVDSNPLATLGLPALMIMFMVIAAIYFYPIYALLKYSTGMKTALQTNDKAKFNEALGYLKGMFKYIGILMIICLALYGIGIIFGLLGAMALNK